MGMDAIVDVWVGVNEGGLERLKIPEEVTKGIFDVGDFSVKGLCFQRITQGYGGEILGFGVVILAHDWDYGVKKLDIPELAKKASDTIIKVRDIFKAWGNEGVEPAVYLSTDYR